MQALSDADASFLYFETPANHMHVLATILLDTSAEVGWSAENVVQLLQQRMGLMGPLRQKLLHATLRLHHPVWVDVPVVDVRQHVSRVTCAAPGSMVELAHEVATFAAVQLKRSRPLWECLVVEGMADGRAAVVFKIHHCTTDGVGATQLLSALFDLEPAGPTDGERLGETQSPQPSHDGTPSVLEVAWHTARGLARRQRQTIRVGLKASRAMTELLSQRALGGQPAEPAPRRTAPRAPFNGAITAARSVAFVDIALSDVKTIKSAVEGTFNDAITGITGSALRSYLLGRRQLPPSSLIAAIPVSTRGAESDPAGNVTSAMFTSLGTHIADPLQRLAAVREANEVAKRDPQVTGSSLIARASSVVSPATNEALARFYSAARFADRHPVVHNLVLSNVAGPSFQVYLAGARVEGIFPLGPVMEGPGLNITIVSYRDRVGVGIIACRAGMPDVAALAAEFPAAVEELLLAIRREGKA